MKNILIRKEKYEKRLLSVFLALFLMLGVLPGTALAANKSGKYGPKAAWTLDSAGTLTITGSGAMPDYSLGNTPWGDCRNDIKKVVIQKGITRIGVSAFIACNNLTGVTIPSGVTQIGDYALYNCRSLKSVDIPAGVTQIGVCAFSGCESLTNVTIPSGVTQIEYSTFSGCGSLTDVAIPTGVTEIG